MEKKKPVDKTIYKGKRKPLNSEVTIEEVPVKKKTSTKLKVKEDISTKPLEPGEVLPEKDSSKAPIKIKMNSTLTENSTILDEQLIDWEGDSLNKILSRCVKLACSIAPNKLYDYQIVPMRRIFKSVLTNDGANITMLFGRQMGKSEITAVTIATLLIIAPLLSKMFPNKFPYFKHGIMIGMFAPTAEQCATTHARIELVLSHDATNAILIDPDIRAKKRYDSGIIEVKGDLKKVNGKEEAGWNSFVRFQTGAKQAKIESKSYHIVFNDEAQEMDDTKITKSILPMLAAYNGTSVYTGTPSTQICEFYNAILRNRTIDVKKKDQNDHNHFEYDYKVGQMYNPRYKQFIKNTKERLGENSDAFQMSYALKWLIEKGMALTAQDFSNYLAKTDLEIELFPTGGSQYVAGLDLGKGKDCSILTIFRVQKTGDGKVVKTVARWEELSNVSWRAQYNEILQWVNTYGIVALAVDATGKGDPICEELVEYLEDTDCVVYDVNFNLKSKNELAVTFYEEMYQGNIIVPSGRKTRAIKQYTSFYTQFITAVKTYNKGLVQIEHPPEVTGASDDYVDSFLLGLHAAKKAIVYEVRQEMNPLFGPKSKNGEDIYRKVYETHRIRINDLFAGK